MGQAADEVSPWASESGVEAAARAHVLLLMARGALDEMHALLAALRRRHKAVRQTPQVSSFPCHPVAVKALMLVACPGAACPGAADLVCCTS